MLAGAPLLPEHAAPLNATDPEHALYWCGASLAFGFVAAALLSWG